MNDNNGTQTITQQDGNAVKLFPASRNDLSQLGLVAKEAALDVKDRVSVHAGRAKQHLNSLVGNARNEGGTHLGEIKVKASQIRGQALDVVKQRPVVSIGVALVIGIVLASVIRRARAAK